MIDVVAPVLGFGLLALLGLDVFITVFHPEGHGGPLTRRQSGGVWRLWKAVAPAGEGRDPWLALGGPVLAVLTPATWALLLVFGFALVYYPWIERFLVSPGTLRAPWAEALYFSGFTAATLGTGDLVPDAVPLRLLSIVETVSGFALFSAALSYILAVYRENGRKVTLASELALHWRLDGARDIPGAAGGERDRWLEEVARELCHVIQAHAQYPILHYFRASDPRNALVLQLAPLVALAADGPPYGGASPDRDAPPVPGTALAVEALERHLAAADARFVRAPASQRADSGPAERYRRLRAYLGYPAGSDADRGR